MRQFQLSSTEHAYPKNFRLLNDGYLRSHLAALCSPECKQPEINQRIEALYRAYFHTVVADQFRYCKQKLLTRMAEFHPESGFLEDDFVDRDQKVVTVNMARAGALPSQTIYNELNLLLDVDNVRQDHVYISRTTDENEQVTGSSIAGSKIGGPVSDSLVLLPDPMAATGSSLVKVLNEYKKYNANGGTRFIAMHLIVTPEYLRNIFDAHPDVLVYAIRLDRGLSAPEILKKVPGQDWDNEKGLNDRQYIVPGGGGFGEILNNAFV